MMKKILGTLAVAASLISGAAFAQETSAGMSVNETVGDWVVRCFNVKSMAPCDIFYALANSETKQPIVTISIAHFPARNQNAINIRVPLGMSIAKGVVIAASAYTSEKISYRRCNQNGCFVEGIVPNEVLNGLKKSGPEAKLKITPYGGKEAELPFSLKGFNGAYSKMVGLAKDKATDEPPPSEQPAAPATQGDAPAPATP